MKSYNDQGSWIALEVRLVKWVTITSGFLGPFVHFDLIIEQSSWYTVVFKWAWLYFNKIFNCLTIHVLFKSSLSCPCPIFTSWSPNSVKPQEHWFETFPRKHGTDAVETQFLWRAFLDQSAVPWVIEDPISGSCRSVHRHLCGFNELERLNLDRTWSETLPCTCGVQVWHWIIQWCFWSYMLPTVVSVVVNLNLCMPRCASGVSGSSELEDDIYAEPCCRSLHNWTLRMEYILMYDELGRLKQRPIDWSE